MSLIDSHCHLNLGELLENSDELVKRAYEADVKKFIIVGCDLDDSKTAVTLAQKYNQFSAIGIHPHETSKYEKLPDEFYTMINADKNIAVGEIGLDFHYMNSPIDTQTRFFKLQLDFAREFKKPVILHIRDAMSEALNILEDYRDLKFLFHCYSGGTEFLERVLSFKNCLCAFGGALTWKGKASENLREAFLKIPLDKIIFETDCPYMTPAPFRGKPNEPAYVKYVYEKACELRGIDLKEFGDITNANMNRFFV